MTTERLTDVEGMGLGASRRPAPAYAPPCLVRVTVETTRMIAGLQTALAHCTQHFHKNVAACPTD